MTQAWGIAAHPAAAVTLDATPRRSADRSIDHRRAFRVGGTKVTLKLDIDAKAPADFPSDVVDVVNANATTLKFE